ncbi:DUF397 domain-containing protein [Streptomyces sp. NPDC017943]|uniref:DUF397 domain-containing protein n=1 Tax=Streptomyces sp. NPDC017943 TaxID=3365019 RepID=UPI0037A2AE46
MIREITAGGEPAWFKSSYSSGNNGESCVELALTPGAVLVRDSKDADGPRIGFTPGTWAAFVPYASRV